MSGGRSVAAALASMLVVLFMCRISEGSSLGVGSVKGTVVVSVVRSGCPGGSIVAVGQASGWGRVGVVVGKGVIGAVVSGTGRGAESGVSSVVGSLTGGAKVAATSSSYGFGSTSS